MPDLNWRALDLIAREKHAGFLREAETERQLHLARRPDHRSGIARMLNWIGVELVAAGERLRRPVEAANAARRRDLADSRYVQSADDQMRDCVTC